MFDNLSNTQQEQQAGITEKLATFLPSSKKVSSLERFWSFVTMTLGTISLLLIFVLSYQPAQNIISPLVSTLRKLQVFSQPAHLETFTFAPAWASSRKFTMIDYQGLKTLAYFDLAVDRDGTFFYDTAGYERLHSQEARDLFYTAHVNGVNVLLTITQASNNDIKSILRSSEAQQTLIEESIREVSETDVDGIVIDFEFEGSAEPEYRALFTTFVKNITRQMHERIPDSQVNVALADTLPSDSLYDVKALSETVDKVALMAYSFAVPEVNNEELVAPLHSYNNEEYMANLEDRINEFRQMVPADKLVVERAWYGNGKNYPLYSSDNQPSLNDGKTQNTLSTPLSNAVVNRLVQNLSAKSREAARKNLPLIAEALEREQILNSNVLAYAIATIEHETAGTFQPIDEFKGRKSARRLGYECGTNYYGRGFIQLTHCRNYEKMGQRIGMGSQLVKNPELASNPKVAASVLAAFFKDNNVEYWATQGDFITARIPINPDAQGWMIATMAERYLAQI